MTISMITHVSTGVLTTGLQSTLYKYFGILLSTFYIYMYNVYRFVDQWWGSFVWLSSAKMLIILIRFCKFTIVIRMKGCFVSEIKAFFNYFLQKSCPEN